MFDKDNDPHYAEMSSNNPPGTPDPVAAAHYVLSGIIREAVASRNAGESVSSVSGQLQAVGIGLVDYSRGPNPDNLLVDVKTRESISEEAIRSLLSEQLGEATANRVPMRVTVSGVIHPEARSAASLVQDPNAYLHREKTDPPLGGISISRLDDTSGTLGCMSTRNDSPGKLFLLSCNHVIAKDNLAKRGDPIIQPGTSDRGGPADAVAKFHSCQPIDFFGEENTVDCAIAEMTVTADKRFLYTDSNQCTRVGFGPKVVTAISECLGVTVGKSGRTTGVTKGTVTTTNATLKAGTAVFVQQIGIQGDGGENFTEPGDSGSVVWLWPPGKAGVGQSYDLVGLHFTADEEKPKTSYSNLMYLVLDSLEINVAT
ncbi:hypothetical protein [Goodfellowiella coeruleoviolacea]|uniref:Uncharacterized protein n=1 Tax=Goodfellowiella coeruleoviolacea TaxID=334858 RepID=A0AAE3GKF4_9PSEU|nr:hypothetical protein [Goodfellowiella coeruleoviolacea]MCP2169110.1 hypothetical protein [Goodfellowiella coeruleoviolacea]